MRILIIFNLSSLTKILSQTANTQWAKLNLYEFHNFWYIQGLFWHGNSEIFFSPNTLIRPTILKYFRLIVGL